MIYLGNNKYQLENTMTGQKITVDASELPRYGFNPPANEPKVGQEIKFEEDNKQQEEEPKKDFLSTLKSVPEEAGKITTGALKTLFPAAYRYGETAGKDILLGTGTVGGAEGTNINQFSEYSQKRLQLATELAKQAKDEKNPEKKKWLLSQSRKISFEVSGGNEKLMKDLGIEEKAQKGRDRTKEYANLAFSTSTEALSWLVSPAQSEKSLASIVANKELNVLDKIIALGGEGINRLKPAAVSGLLAGLSDVDATTPAEKLMSAIDGLVKGVKTGVAFELTKGLFKEFFNHFVSNAIGERWNQLGLGGSKEELDMASRTLKENLGTSYTEMKQIAKSKMEEWGKVLNNIPHTGEVDAGVIFSKNPDEARNIYDTLNKLKQELLSTSGQKLKDGKRLDEILTKIGGSEVTQETVNELQKKGVPLSEIYSIVTGKTQQQISGKLSYKDIYDLGRIARANGGFLEKSGEKVAAKTYNLSKVGINSTNYLRSDPNVPADLLKAMSEYGFYETLHNAADAANAKSMRMLKDRYYQIRNGLAFLAVLGSAAASGKTGNPVWVVTGTIAGAYLGSTASYVGQQTLYNIGQFGSQTAPAILNWLAPKTAAVVGTPRKQEEQNQEGTLQTNY